jgi:hypothetical protein
MSAKSGDAGAYFSTPTGMAERYDLSNTPFGPSTASDEQIVPATGTVAVESSTISGGKSRSWETQQIALRREVPPSVNGTVSTNAVNAGCVDSTISSSTTFAHTVASGTNQVLIVTSGAGTYGEDNSASFDGYTMTKGVARSSSDPAFEEAYNYWYLINPPQGTHDVIVTYPNGANCRQYAAITMQDVDQTTPFDTDGHVGGNGGDPSISVTTTEANELILYFLDYDDRPTNTVYTPNDPSLY